MRMMLKAVIIGMIFMSLDAVETQPVTVTNGVPDGTLWRKLLVSPSGTAGWVCEPGIWRELSRAHPV